MTLDGGKIAKRNSPRDHTQRVEDREDQERGESPRHERELRPLQILLICPKLRECRFLNYSYETHTKADNRGAPVRAYGGDHSRNGQPHESEAHS